MLMRRLCLGAAIVMALSCATVTPPVASLEFFKEAPPNDPWSGKIAEWQDRHRIDPAASLAVEGYDSELARSYADFSQELKRRVAREAVLWIQAQSRRVYEPDGAKDHWATLGEVLDEGADDCDGLDLLTFQLLRRFGFEDREIVRSIVVQRGSGQHHMVTLWFEGGAGDRDPFVLDPTGVVTSGMRRLSAIPDWVPIEAFDEEAHYRVESPASTASVGGR
jgi:hypothetical protein